MKQIHNSNIMNERLYIQSQQKEHSMQFEIEKLGRQLNMVVGEKISNETEYEKQKDHDTFRISQLQTQLSEIQMLCKQKCEQLDEFSNMHEEQSQKIAELEQGRDNWRSQYLEIREINKDLEQKTKALKKEHKAQVQMISQNGIDEQEKENQVYEKPNRDQSKGSYQNFKNMTNRSVSDVKHETLLKKFLNDKTPARYGTQRVQRDDEYEEENFSDY